MDQKFIVTCTGRCIDTAKKGKQFHNKKSGKMRTIHMKSFGSLPKSSNASSYRFVSALEQTTSVSVQNFGRIEVTFRV